MLNPKFFLCVILPLAFVVFSAQAKDRTVFDLPGAYRNAKFQFFPIPFFETEPGAGERYGLMPTFLWYDREEQLMTIAVTALNYNPRLVGIGGFAGLFLYPSARETAEIFLAAAEHFERDFYFHYLNERWLEEKLDVDFELEYEQDPFERFFGFGPETETGNETSFVSHLWLWKGLAAYEIFEHFDLQLEEKWMRMGVFPVALAGISDTATTFAGNSEVTSSNQWHHRLALIWDRRDNQQFPKKGETAEAYGLLAHRAVAARTGYTGFGVQGLKVFTLGQRYTTVLRFLTEHLYGGNIPFYMQSHLGGKKDLRGFVRGRFTGRGRVLFDVEERILVKSWRIMKATFDFSIDPFFSVGQVFDDWGQVRFSHLQPAGGVGFRALVPPSVVGRVDFAASADGLKVYTTLHYPF